MSASLKIDVFDKGATEAVREVRSQLSPKQLQVTYGPRLKELTRDHLKNQPDNKKGWPSTGFWDQAARATRWESRGDNAIAIVVDKIGVRQRWKGGPIKPRNVDALTIPISPVSYGRAAAEFPNLFLLKTPKGAYLVQYGEQVSAKTGRVNTGSKLGGNSSRRIRANLIFLYKLSFGVNQKGDPDVMPTNAEYRAVVFQAARERLTAIKLRRAA